MDDEKRRAREALLSDVKKGIDGGHRRPEKRSDKPFAKNGQASAKPFESRRDRPEKSFEKSDRPAKPFEKSDRPAKPFEKSDRPAKPFDKRSDRPTPKPALPYGVTPSRKAAYDALRLVLRQSGYSGLELNKVFSAQMLSPVDKGLATEIFYGTLEHLRKIDLALSQLYETEPTPEVLDILRMSVYQLMYLDRVPEHSVCDEAVKLTKAIGLTPISGFVNGVLRSFCRQRGELRFPKEDEEDGIPYLACESALPDFVCRLLIAQYGYENTKNMLLNRSGRYMVLRPNAMRISEAEFERGMTGEGWAFEKAVIPGAYRVSGVQAVDASNMFRRGLFSVQSESSLLCAQAVGARPSMRVLDACAAPGGKACAIAESMNGTGRVFACDLHAHRVELIRAQAQRLGLEDNVRVRQQDATVFVPEWENAMDAVLCDVPCSGLGVLSSKPDIRLRLTREELISLPQVQSAILENCARYVRKGGTLVYSTCTILGSENRDVVTRFLAAHPEFALDDIRPFVPQELADAADGGMLNILPGVHTTEGFFIARMKRK